MLVAHMTKVGGWNMSLAHDDSWWVTHRPSESQWHIYGPYGSKDEAFEESGMPKPKTQLEEADELIYLLAQLVHQAVIAPSLTHLAMPDAEMYRNADNKIRDYWKKWRKA